MGTPKATPNALKRLVFWSPIESSTTPDGPDYRGG